MNEEGNDTCEGCRLLRNCLNGRYCLHYKGYVEYLNMRECKHKDGKQEKKDHKASAGTGVQ